MPGMRLPGNGQLDPALIFEARLLAFGSLPSCRRHRDAALPHFTNKGCQLLNVSLGGSRCYLYRQRRQPELPLQLLQLAHALQIQRFYGLIGKVHRTKTQVIALQGTGF